MLQYDQMYDRKKLVPRSAKKFKLSMEIRITLYLISVSIPRLYLSIYQDLSWRIKFSLLRDISEKRSIYERERRIYIGHGKVPLILCCCHLPTPQSILIFNIYILLFCFFLYVKTAKPSGPAFYFGTLHDLREGLWMIKI